MTVLKFLENMNVFFSVLLCAIVWAGDVEEKFPTHNIVPQLLPAAPKQIPEYLQDQIAVTTEESPGSTELIPHDGLIKATFVVNENDTTVHYKVDSPKHITADLSDQTGDESLLITESPYPHNHMIIAAFKLNDSLLHTKVLNEEEILHHMTEVYDTTEPPVPHDGVVRAAYVSEDSIIHSVAHTQEELKAIQGEDIGDSKEEVSKIDEYKVGTAKESLNEGHISSLVSDGGLSNLMAKDSSINSEGVSSTELIHKEKSTDEGKIVTLSPESVKSVKVSTSTV